MKLRYVYTIQIEDINDKKKFGANLYVRNIQSGVWTDYYNGR